MKKLSLIPIALIVLVGAVWASSFITPDKPGFPSLPTNPGTLGDVLTNKFRSDGTALNTEKLGGVVAAGYLEKTDVNCSIVGEVWKGFDTDGTVICGTRGILLAIGRFDEIVGEIQVSTDNGSTWSPANKTDILREGTIVKSTTGTGTIAFIADNSILRLDTGTIVQLETGDLDGNTVAQAIVNSGSLWGRILTSTGVNIGGGGLIAGVRGTSISVQKKNTGYYKFMIVDSQNTGGDAATLKLSSSNITKNISALTSIPEFLSGALTSASTLLSGSPSVELSTVLADTWIRKNTIADLDYLATIISTTLDTAQQDTIKQEIQSAAPTDIASLRVLQLSTTEDAQSILSADDEDDEDGSSADSDSPSDKAERKAKRRTCTREQTYIAKESKCVDIRKLLTYREFPGTSPTGSPLSVFDLHGRSNIWNITASGGSTNIVDSNGEYLAYNLTSRQKSGLIGKTITIELSGIDPADGKKRYILDFGSTEKYYIIGNTLYANVPSKGWFDENRGNVSARISIPIQTTPSQMIIGNTSSFTPAYNLPIGTTIQKITIQ